MQLSLMLAIWACAAVWVTAVVRWRHRRPVLPYQPRRPVPWGIVDLAMVLLFFLAAEGVLGALVPLVVHPADVRPPATHGAEEAVAENPLVRLAAEKNPWTFLVCFVSVVVVAPLFEELAFRVLLQGWFEAVERRWRRRMRRLRQLAPRGLGPIVLASLLFAAMHFRTAGPPLDPQLAAVLFAGDSVAKVLTALLALCLLRWGAGATAADLGWAPRKMLADAGLGLLAFAAVVVPVYAMQTLLTSLLPKTIAPDPIPLFFFALALGTLYFRTHRMMPSVALHAALNGATLALVWFGSR